MSTRITADIDRDMTVGLLAGDVVAALDALGLDQVDLWGYSNGAGVALHVVTSHPERVRKLTDAYREAGGSGSCVMVRRVWVGPPPRELLDQQLDVYRSYSSESAMQHWEGD